jgi:hypothetical protein
MDHNELLDRIAKAEADLSKFSNELMEKRLEDDSVSESITTNAMIAHSSLYITRISFERACKKLDALKEQAE